MEIKRLDSALRDRSKFAIMVELTGSPGFGFGPIEHFLSVCKDSTAALPTGFEIVGIASPQTPGGAPNIEPMAVITHAQSNDLLGDLDFIPHITCKDQNTDAILSSLMSYKKLGVSSVLAFTGDKPIAGKGVFELDSVGLIDMISSINAQSYMKAKPDDLDSVHQFNIGAAVSPFKYTEASQMQQYYKMEKKIASGAGFLVTQVGWDWKKSQELFTYLKERNLDTPVIGNVFLLSTITPAPRLMHDGKLPGCFVSDAFLDKIYSEAVDDHIERAAQQVAMYKDMGAAGVDIGSVHDYDILLKIITRADEIGSNWKQYKDNLYWPAEDAFYLYDDDGSQVTLSKPKRTLSQANFDFMHRAILDSDYRGFHAFKSVMGCLGAKKQKGFVYKTFNMAEKAAKYILFDCQECGDCFLTENFSLCTMGGCEKGLANVPCGDADHRGYCGNNLERVCIGELVYNAAAAKKDGIDKWIDTICPPRDHKLHGTSSILNHLFSTDHGKRSPIISIAEAINAYSPQTAKLMKLLDSLGRDAYTKASGPLNYIRAIIESQARENPDYILLTLDPLARDDKDQLKRIMTEYITLVRKWGKGVPVCIDSKDADILTMGLKEWYNTTDKVKKPLLICTPEHADTIIPLKSDFDFAITFSLPTPEGNNPVHQLVTRAKILFARSRQNGFKADDIFFELSINPLSRDLPESDTALSATHIAFETIRQIKADKETTKAHCMVRVSISCISMPRSIGVCRAFVAKAMEYGLDAGVVNVAHRYGFSDAAPALLDFVDAFAKIDGSAENHVKAAKLSEKLLATSKKTSK